MFELPVLDFAEIGTASPAWLKSSTGRKFVHELDALIDPQTFKDRAILQINDARREEVTAINQRAEQQQSQLYRKVESLKNELRQIENAMTRTAKVTRLFAVEVRNGG